MIRPGRSQLHRSTARAAAVVVLSLLALTLTGQAVAASCGKKVIDDWYGDGRVDGTYALHCYDDAIEALPRDVRDYSSAKEDIERAMQAAMRGEEAPPSTSDPDGDPTTGGGGGSDGDDNPTGTGTGPGDTPGDTGPEAAPGVDTASSDSIPLPLLVLGGLALLLVAAGSLGYLVRRLQARRVPPASR